MSISEPMHMSKPGPEAVRRLEVFTGAGRRRSWTAEEKAAFVAASYATGETVCGVARRHGLTPQQLFTWRREARLRDNPVDDAVAAFVPVEIETPAAALARSPMDRRAGIFQASIELEIDGVTVRIGRDAPATTIAAVLRALKAGA
jgi:transposase